MKAFRYYLISLLVLLALILVVILAFWLGYSRNLRESISPDGSLKAFVRQNPVVFIDRNFTVLIMNMETRKTATIFESWDQSPQIKEEHFVWSSDSRKVALVGDAYFTVPGSRLENGLIVFLVYDFDTKKLFCNTDHLDRRFEPIPVAKAIELFGNRLK